MIRLAKALVICLTALTLSLPAQAEPRTTHGLSLFGAVKYPADFAHFDYVNPDAPKGGVLRQADIGSFDSLNPFIVKGEPAAGLGLIYDTLMTEAADEPSSEYGLLAGKVTVPEDFAWVEFHLRPEARWHDGKPVTPDDVIFSFENLKEKGRPFFRYYYANVVKAEKTGPHSVKFSFSESGNRELPQIMGQLPILPKHYYETRAFDATTLEPPLSSGPYKIGAFEPGRFIRYERVEDYWGKDLPVMVGQNNFDQVAYEYYRDSSVALEAFKAGEFDLRAENTAKNWATAYTGPAVEKGHIVKEMVPETRAQPMQAFIFNTRRDKFSDPRVRRAFALAFDFEATNEALFYGQYTRTLSYFHGSELAATGLPEGPERALLEPFRAELPEEVFTKPYWLPVTDGKGRNREGLIAARKLLEQAGWTIKDKVLTHTETGQTMEVEFLIVSPAFERIVARYMTALNRLGVTSRIKLVDPTQFQNRVDAYDFDIMSGGWAQSLSPGNEQRDFWGSEAADRQGGRNYAGIKNPVVDALIDKIIFAPDRAALVAATRALDRVLLWNHYVVPQWHIGVIRLARWDRFGIPRPLPAYSPVDPMTWWMDADKAAKIDTVRETK